jgi:hypothetical protein
LCGKAATKDSESEELTAPFDGLRAIGAQRAQKIGIVAAGLKPALTEPFVTFVVKTVSHLVAALPR